MIPTKINGRWTLLLPEHRAARPEWVTGWETERIAAMHDYITEAQAQSDAEHVRLVVVDVGAEEGDMSAMWASWGCDVFLIEPNPKVWPNIRAIFEANDLTDRASGHWVGFCSDVTEDVTNHDEDHLRMTQTAFEGAGWPVCAFGEVIGNHGFRHLAEETDITPQKRLDGMVGRCDVITMDVEGAELHVLRGAEALLANSRPEVFVSIHPEFLKAYWGITPDDIHRFMRTCGYRAKHLATDHEEHWQYTPEERA